MIIGLDGDRTDPIPTGIRSSGEVMFVQFDSDSSVGATGFNATYTSIDAGQNACFSNMDRRMRSLCVSVDTHL